MCEVKSKKKQQKTNPKKKKVQWSATKKIDYDEPHLMLNEKAQPIEWTERPTCALAAAGLLWLCVD
jgi:hypothetical protein